MMRKILLVTTSIILSFSSFSQIIQSNKDITSNELLYHISILASDSLQGRYPGTTFDKISAKYIKDQFEKSGLQLLCNKGYQFFTIEKPSEKRFETTHLMIDGKMLTNGVDYTTLPSKGSDSLCANAVFVGFGFDGKQPNTYNDYQNVDVKRKWVVIINGSTQTDSSKNDIQQIDFSKITIAKEHNAAGVIILANNEVDNQISLPSNNDFKMPLFILKQEAANNFLKSLGDIENLKRKIITDNKSASLDLTVRICGKVGNSFDEINTQNIIAIVKGNDPKLSDEYIVVGAHYDHLGLGGKNTTSRRPDTIAVHNGADDNASGVSAIMEIAQKMAAEQKELKRSVIFIAFGAEEMGLVGSQRFIESDIIPVKNIKAMINLDMVGRMVNNKLEISGTKTSVQSESILKELDADSTLKLALSPGGFGPSDHASFYAKDIPVFFLTTGIHADYHTPFDDVDKINTEGMLEVSNYAYSLAYKLATMDSTLIFTKSANRMMPTRGDYKMKVKLGIIPDVSGSSNNGLKAIGVTDDKPAALAGMKNGDIIVAINGKPVHNIYDYMERLSELNPGTSVTVEVLRGEEKHTLTVNI